MKKTIKPILPPFDKPEESDSSKKRMKMLMIDDRAI